MDDNFILHEAQNYLESLPRIEEIEEVNAYKGNVFLLPRHLQYEIYKNSLIKVTGLKNKYNEKIWDLISIIYDIEDALNITFMHTNILTPLAYAESLEDVLWHLNTQGILFTKVSKTSIEWIRKAKSIYTYGKHEADQFWLPFSKPIETIKEGDRLCIFNRRIGGWDGSCERPVIELLGAGGHVPMVWEGSNQSFRILTVKENLKKEIREELGIFINDENISIFGGYKNETTHELVVLSGIEILDSYLQSIQEHAFQNISENEDGIYLGTFEEVINYYQNTPEPFAGGSKTTPYNFPNRVELMGRVLKYLNSR